MYFKETIYSMLVKQRLNRGLYSVQGQFLHVSWGTLNLYLSQIYQLKRAFWEGWGGQSVACSPALLEYKEFDLINISNLSINHTDLSTDYPNCLILYTKHITAEKGKYIYNLYL